jgi:kinesin family member 11
MSRISTSTDISESIKVFIRQRPELSTDGEKDSTSVGARPKELSTGIKNVSSSGTSCTYYNATNKTEQSFIVDKYFLPDAEQEVLFEVIAQPIIDSALLGYSGTILAYGPTSSGKTFTMRGGDGVQRGIMPRLVS